ncbi:hypothetical protein TNCT_410731 [Trichonephila clavata]|uniref:Uncharacterized protein n=1 Tax=Trichonephila clavata TaxID=2740835 RepID=A0A8X6FX14_TRICU|nr:hypothetical protein TNCT_410731 [Trichonephila clavata]
MFSYLILKIRDFECTKGKDIQLESEEELSTLALGQETETSETNLAKSSFVKLQRMDESLDQSGARLRTNKMRTKLMMEF